MKLDRDRRTICGAIGNKDLCVASLHTEPEHPPYPVYQLPVRTRYGDVVCESLDSGGASRGGSECRINRDRKKQCSLGPPPDEFLNEVITGCRESVCVVQDNEKVIPRWIAGPCWRGVCGYCLNLNVVRKGCGDVGLGMRGDSFATVLVQDD